MTQWFWRGSYLNFITEFSLFRNYLPLEKGVALHLNKLESSLPKGALCHVWLKLALWFWRKVGFLYFVYAFCYYPPLEWTRSLFEKILNPLHPRTKS